MSARRRQSVLIGWSRSLSVLALWKRGKTDAVVDGEVVLTKMKLFSGAPKKDCLSESSQSSISIQSFESASELETINRTRPQPSQRNVSQNPSPNILSLFESEDSGVELPATPFGSEKSFIIMGRDSSCDSRNSNPEVSRQNDVTLDGGGHGEEKRCSQKPLKEHRETSWKSGNVTRSLEEHMDECCRKSPTGFWSGLEYLERVCTLMERISQLQRQLRSVRTHWTEDRDTLDFMLQTCSCGAANRICAPSSPHLHTPTGQKLGRTGLYIQASQKLGRTGVYSQTGQKLGHTSVYIQAECESAPWRTRGEEDGCSRVSPLNRSDRSRASWRRVRDLVTRTRLRSQSGLNHRAFKTSCTQLYISVPP